MIVHTEWKLVQITGVAYTIDIISVNIFIGYTYSIDDRFTPDSEYNV